MKNTTLNLQFQLPEGTTNYLEAAANIRGISRTQLMRRTMEIILKDQMFLSILDDANEPSTKTAARHGTGRPRLPSTTQVFDALKPVGSVPTRRGPVSRYASVRYQATKTQMEDDLKQAVLNTGGELVK